APLVLTVSSSTATVPLLARSPTPALAATPLSDAAAPPWVKGGMVDSGSGRAW
ncbi:hypothetical protein VDGL01_12578, partial [Verticillium dahliae]